MYNNVVPSPLLGERTTTDPSPSVHRQAANVPFGSTEEIALAWTPDVTNPLSRDALGRMSVLDDGLDIYPSFLVGRTLL
jgi:hypothetical protein